jgi:hypothetical protein
MGSDETHGSGRAAAVYQSHPGPLLLDHRSLACVFHVHGLTASYVINYGWPGRSNCQGTRKTPIAPLCRSQAATSKLWFILPHGKCSRRVGPNLSKLVGCGPSLRMANGRGLLGLGSAEFKVESPKKRKHHDFLLSYLIEGHVEKVRRIARPC